VSSICRYSWEFLDKKSIELAKLSVIIEKSKSDPVAFIYWTRVSLAVLVSVVNVAFELTDIPGVIVGVGMYLMSYCLARYVLKIQPEAVGSKTKLYTIGIGAYILLWLFLWTFFYTISRTAF